MPDERPAFFMPPAPQGPRRRVMASIEDEIDRMRDEVRRNPSDVAQQIWLLATLALNGDNGALATGFRRIVEWKPEWTQLHYDIVEDWCHPGRASDLLAVFEGETDPVGLYAYGLVLQVTHRQQEAIAAYRRALALEPELAVVRHNLGISLLTLGRNDEAAQECLRAVQLAPTMAEPHFLLTPYFLDHDDQTKAITHEKQFLALAYPYLGKYVLQAKLMLASIAPDDTDARRDFWNERR